MGLVDECPQAYADSSVLSYVDGFPDEPDRLLIAHGLIDENVHFRHTEVLIKELIRAGKPHRVQGLLALPLSYDGTRSLSR